MSELSDYPYVDYPPTKHNGGDPAYKRMDALEARLSAVERVVFPNGQPKIMPPPEKAQPRADTRFHDPDAQLTRGQMGFISDICARLKIEMPGGVEGWNRKQASAWIDENKGKRATA